MLDKCTDSKCNCQKQFTFIPKQIQLEGIGFKIEMPIFFKSAQFVWNIFSKPAVNIEAPFIGMVVGAKTKIANVAQVITKL